MIYETPKSDLRIKSCGRLKICQNLAKSAKSSNSQEKSSNVRVQFAISKKPVRPSVRTFVTRVRTFSVRAKTQRKQEFECSVFQATIQPRQEFERSNQDLKILFLDYFSNSFLPYLFYLFQGLSKDHLNMLEPLTLHKLIPNLLLQSINQSHIQINPENRLKPFSITKLTQNPH